MTRRLGSSPVAGLDHARAAAMAESSRRREARGAGRASAGAAGSDRGLQALVRRVTMSALRSPRSWRAQVRCPRSDDAPNGGREGQAAPGVTRCGWRRWDSNPRPPACKAGALPAELRPRVGLDSIPDPPGNRHTSSRHGPFSPMRFGFRYRGSRLVDPTRARQPGLPSGPVDRPVPSPLRV